MSKRVISFYILSGFLILAFSIFAFVSVRSIVFAMTETSLEHTSKAQMQAAVQISQTKDRLQHAMQVLSSGKEVTLVFRMNNGESSLVVVKPDANSKQTLQSLIRSDSCEKEHIKDGQKPKTTTQHTKQKPKNTTKEKSKKLSVYHIQKGDTLSGISDKVCYSVDELAKYNKISDVNLIYAGSSLRVPNEAAGE